MLLFLKSIYPFTLTRVSTCSPIREREKKPSSASVARIGFACSLRDYHGNMSILFSLILQIHFARRCFAECWHCSVFFDFISCWFNIAIVRIGSVQIVKIHSHSNLKFATSTLHSSPKQNDEHLLHLNNSSSKKKKSTSGNPGSASTHTGGQEKSSANMFSGRAGPQVRRILASRQTGMRVFRDLLRWILVLSNIAIESRKSLVSYNNSAKGRESTKNERSRTTMRIV